MSFSSRYNLSKYKNTTMVKQWASLKLSSTQILYMNTSFVKDFEIQLETLSYHGYMSIDISTFSC